VAALVTGGANGSGAGITDAPGRRLLRLTAALAQRCDRVPDGLHLERCGECVERLFEGSAGLRCHCRGSLPVPLHRRPSLPINALRA
jgi:hypothetical protein